MSQILELLEHNPIFSAGYKCVLHIHSAVEECECTAIIAEIVNPKTGEKKKVPALLRGFDAVHCRWVWVSRQCPVSGAPVRLSGSTATCRVACRLSLLVISRLLLSLHRLQAET